MFKDRLKTAVPLALITLIAFLMPGVPGILAFMMLASAALTLATKEFFAMFRKLGCEGMENQVLLLGLARLWFSTLWLLSISGDAGKVKFFDWVLVDFIFFGLLILMVFVALCRRPLTRESVVGAFISLGGYLYICWPLSLAVRGFLAGGVGEMWTRYLVLALLIVVRLGDTGGYVVGSLTAKLMRAGNHKIAPVLSPKKSWEGLFGGMIFSAIGAGLLWWWLEPYLRTMKNPINFDIGLRWAVMFAFASAIIGLLGDLAESALKRGAKVKDSGNIPGLGGALDLMDSVLVNIPVFLMLILYLTLPRLGDGG